MINRIAMSMNKKAEPSAEFAIETFELTKSYKGDLPGEHLPWVFAIADGIRKLVSRPQRRTVVDGVSLTVRRGELFGVVGSNGAGKTTLLKLIACLLYPDSGGGLVNGYDLIRQRMDVRRSVAIAKAQGWLGLLWQLNGVENLLFRARMCGIPSREAKRRVEHVIERLEVAHKAKSYSWEWSMGETQRFNLAMTFIAHAPLVILDEPTSHLDPRGARLVREFIKEDLNRLNGQTVIMSTHYLEEADLLCDRVAILHKGRVLACDTPGSLKQSHLPERLFEARVTGYAPEIGNRVKEKLDLAELIERFEDITTGQARLRPKWRDSRADLDALRRELEADGVTVASINEAAPTLDDVYFHLTKERVK